MNNTTTITTTITDAYVLETAKDRINPRTAEPVALTKVVTTKGQLLTIWHDDNRCPASQGDEVKILEETTAKLKDDGTPYINYAIIPAAFAAKIAL